MNEAELCREFECYCAAQGWPKNGDALDMLQRPDLTQPQRDWLEDFIRRWDVTMSSDKRT